MAYTKQFISHSPAAWEVQDQGAGRSGEGLLSGSCWRFLTVSSHGRKGKGALQGHFYQAVIPGGPCPHDLMASQRPHLLIPPLWGLEFQHGNLRGTQISRPQRLLWVKNMDANYLSCLWQLYFDHEKSPSEEKANTDEGKANWKDHKAPGLALPSMTCCLKHSFFV